jgi:hypothetical protein
VATETEHMAAERQVPVVPDARLQRGDHGFAAALGALFLLTQLFAVLGYDAGVPVGRMSRERL